MPCFICWRDSDKDCPGAEPQTSTSMGASSSEASSIAFKFSLIAVSLSFLLIAGKKPPRHNETTSRFSDRRNLPVSRVSLPVIASLHTVIPATPASENLRADCSIVHGFSVMVWIHNFERSLIADALIVHNYKMYNMARS